MIIFTHGLGQTERSWDDISKNLQENSFRTPNLFRLQENEQPTFENIYKGFANYCDDIEGKLDLCGISLGGTIALIYAVKNPQKINSLTIIAPIFKIPKTLFTIQMYIFKIIPAFIFKKIGLPQKNTTLKLLDSMKNLNFEKEITEIKTKTTIICGEKDLANKKQCKELNQLIKNSRLFFAKNASHEVNIQNPDIISKILTENISK